MRRSPLEYLRHIRDEARYLARCSVGLSGEHFARDETLKRAFVRSIEVIGEAAKQLPSEFRAEHPDIEWRAIAGMRDKLVHDYLGIDYDIVWDVVTNKVPAVLRQVEEILRSEEES
jgi:uncharacterized protein with HEPN domain